MPLPALENHVFSPLRPYSALICLVRPIGAENLTFSQTSHLRLETSLIVVIVYKTM